VPVLYALVWGRGEREQTERALPALTPVTG
jgi:hypothetical protein